MALVSTTKGTAFNGEVGQLVKTQHPRLPYVDAVEVAPTLGGAASSLREFSR